MAFSAISVLEVTTGVLLGYGLIQLGSVVRLKLRPKLPTPIVSAARPAAMLMQPTPSEVVCSNCGKTTRTYIYPRCGGALCESCSIWKW